jgi:hypothetical protein
MGVAGEETLLGVRGRGNTTPPQLNDRHPEADHDRYDDEREAYPQVNDCVCVHMEELTL